MASEEIFNIATSGKNGPLRLIFSCSYDDGYAPADELNFKLQLSDGTLNTSIIAKSELLNGLVSFQIPVPDALTTCLLGCAAKALLGPLIECFDKDPSKYLKCLQAKGVSIAQDTAVCATGCFAQ